VPVSLHKPSGTATRTCKGGVARPCSNEQSVVVYAIRKIPATALGPAQEVDVAIRVCASHAARLLVGRTVDGIGRIISKEQL
jgi:hypothetical protein